MLVLASLYLFILALSIVLSGSRAGVLSLIVVSTVLLWQRVPASNRLKATILFVIIVVSLVGLYFLKKDSANGRFLIWKCSWNLFLDKPIFGHGIGGFEAHYMDYQATYFRENPDSKYTILADTVQHPFNEYIRIGVDYGIVGVLILLGCIFFVAFCYKNKKEENAFNQAALLCLISIGTFSFFSYPFLYPFVWLMCFASIFIIILTYAEIFSFRFSILARKAICFLFLGFSVFALMRLHTNRKAQKEWRRLSTRFVGKDSESLFQQYEDVYYVMKNDRYFLYNYAAVLYDGKAYQRSLMVANECRRAWADYDLELLIAENYVKQHKYEEAEKHFRLASEMCPNRFAPLYKMVLLYKDMQEEEKALNLARIIVEKPVKVPSQQIQWIKKQMGEFK